MWWSSDFASAVSGQKRLEVCNLSFIGQPTHNHVNGSSRDFAKIGDYSIILVESIVEEVLFVGVLGAKTAAGLGQVVGFLAAIVCGAYGNRWYLSHARKVISNIRAQGLEEHAALVPKTVSFNDFSRF